MKKQLLLTTASFGLAALNLFGATLYVSLDSRNPTPPFATWATAATKIQDAVDAARDGDTVLVTNGVYAVGARMTTNEWGEVDCNRVLVTNGITLQSVNGPLMTCIDGGKTLDEGGNPTNSSRCVFLGTDAILSGFTLTNGYVFCSYLGGVDGGGVWCSSTNAILTNCVITGNSASLGGGGASGGTLYNCTLSGNSASDEGGGAESCTLYNCTLSGNVAYNGRGGGAVDSTLYNCRLTGNSSILEGKESGHGGGAYGCDLYNCTLTDNSATTYGGGACYSMLYNCTLTGNSSDEGGGAERCNLYNCTLTGNSAENEGGGADDCSLYNCTVADNSAGEVAGGANGGTLYNCIVYYNRAPHGANWFTGVDHWGNDVSSLLNFCCTTPLPTNGVGNILGPPLFMDMSAGDFRLWEGSPCIDAGTNLIGMSFVDYDWATGDEVMEFLEPTDVLGNTRFIDGNGDGKVAWDIGAYEFNSFQPPRFTAQPQLTANGCMLCLTGAPNKWVTVQRSSNLKDWEDIWSGFMSAEGEQQVVDGDTSQNVMFYRAVVP